MNRAKPVKKKRCIICRHWFRPDPRTRHQVCCGNPQCRRRRKSATNRRWRDRNAGYERTRNSKKRAWARGCDYWRRYRLARPEYTATDNRRRRLALSRQHSSARQAMMREIAVERLESIGKMSAPGSARQDLIARRVEVIEDYLFMKGRSARQAAMESDRGAGP